MLENLGVFPSLLFYKHYIIHPNSLKESCDNMGYINDSKF